MVKLKSEKSGSITGECPQICLCFSYWVKSILPIHKCWLVFTKVVFRWSLRALNSPLILIKEDKIFFPPFRIASCLLYITFCKKSHKKPIISPWFWSLPQTFFQDSAVPQIDFSLLAGLNLRINSKHLFKPVFFHPFYVSIFSHVLFLRAVVEVGMHSVAQSIGRCYKHFYKVVAIKYQPSGYISI